MYKRQIDYYGNNSITSNSGNQIVFRYAGALLLYAEALAALGTNDTKANELLNRIRHRAGASESFSSGKELQDAIFWERQRELIGEGHYYYDLVRTGKISNIAYCAHPIRRTDFNVGAWTVSYTHLRAHETGRNLVCRLLLEKKKKKKE